MIRIREEELLEKRVGVELGIFKEDLEERPRRGRKTVLATKSL